jgi:hypothetical protein
VIHFANKRIPAVTVHFDSKSDFCNFVACIVDISVAMMNVI